MVATGKAINRSCSEVRNSSTGERLRTKAGKDFRALFPSDVPMGHEEVIRAKRACGHKSLEIAELRRSCFYRTYQHLYFSSVHCETPMGGYKKFFIQQTHTEWLLSARHWGQRNEQKRQNPFSPGQGWGDRAVNTQWIHISQTDWSAGQCCKETPLHSCAPWNIVWGRSSLGELADETEW